MAYFSDIKKDEVWNRATIVEGYNPRIWRQDLVGAWIKYDQYGEQSKYGWEIDHLIPLSRGGTDDINNLNAMHWRNNMRKSNDYPVFFSELTANGNRNIEEEKQWRIRSNNNR